MARLILPRLRRVSPKTYSTPRRWGGGGSAVALARERDGVLVAAPRSRPRASLRVLPARRGGPASPLPAGMPAPLITAPPTPVWAVLGSSTGRRQAGLQRGVGAQRSDGASTSRLDTPHPSPQDMGGYPDPASTRHPAVSYPLPHPRGRLLRPCPFPLAAAAAATTATAPQPAGRASTWCLRAARVTARRLSAL